MSQSFTSVVQIETERAHEVVVDVLRGKRSQTISRTKLMQFTVCRGRKSRRRSAD